MPRTFGSSVDYTGGSLSLLISREEVWMSPSYDDGFLRANLYRIPVGLLMVLFFWSFIALEKGYSQSCERYGLEPVANWDIQYRKRGNRCEGFYNQVKVSSGAINVVGVIMGKLQFKLQEDEVLEITSPVVRDRPVHVRAVGIPIKTYYRMDATIDVGEKLIWPMKDVIYRRKLSARKIGLFGWIGEENKKTFVPVRAEAKLESMAKDETLWMYLRTSVNVESVKWRWCDIINGVPTQLGRWQDTPELYYRAGKPIAVPLPASKTGDLLFEAAAKETTRGQWLKGRARVIVKQNHEN